MFFTYFCIVGTQLKKLQSFNQLKHKIINLEMKNIFSNILLEINKKMILPMKAKLCNTI